MLEKYPTGTLYERQMAVLSKLGEVHIRYVPNTGAFYVDITDIMKKSGSFLKGIIEHRSSKEEAVKAYCRAIIGKTLTKEVSGSSTTCIYPINADLDLTGCVVSGTKDSIVIPIPLR